MKSFVRREFLGSTWEDDERNWRMEKSTSLGMPPWHPLWISRTIKRQSLGMPKASPLLHRHPSGRLRWNYVFITFHIMCYSWSVILFFFQFVLVCLLVMYFVRSYLSCVGETRSAFSLENSCASLIFCWVFLALFFLPALVLGLYSFKRC